MYNYLKQKRYRTRQILKNKIKLVDDEKQKWVGDTADMEAYLKQERYESILSDSILSYIADMEACLFLQSIRYFVDIR
jgi:hypothetical protein